MASLHYWGPYNRPNFDHIDPGNSGGSVVIPETPPAILTAKQPTFVCGQCGLHFETSDALFDHRFAAHPLRRPVLVLDGRELLTPRHTIRKLLNPRAIASSNTSACWVNNTPTNPAELAEIISTLKNGFVTIRLRSQDGPLEVRYELDVAVPESEDLAEVERRFFELANDGDLSLAAIERFIRLTRSASTALGLVDALSNYLYGVLAKDQKGGTHLSQDEGRIKFNRALQSLEAFDGGLAAVLVELINFNQNVFSDGLALRAVPALQTSMRCFYDLLCPNAAPLERNVEIGETSVGMPIPLDSTTDQIIHWASMTDAMRVEHIPSMVVALDADTWTPDDTFKVRILLALTSASAGNFKNAGEYARRIRNDITFSHWAESLILRSKEV